MFEDLDEGALSKILEDQRGVQKTKAADPPRYA